MNTCVETEGERTEDFFYFFFYFIYWCALFDWRRELAAGMKRKCIQTYLPTYLPTQADRQSEGGGHAS